jgi:hypothetical protein
MIMTYPPHETDEELIAYLTKLATYFEDHAKRNGIKEPEWPWGDIVPLRASAKRMKELVLEIDCFKDERRQRNMRRRRHPY